MSPKHPRAVGTRADFWIPWIEGTVGIKLRQWQREVLARALEIDADGNWCWWTICISTPRQSGKSILVGALALARAHHADEFGEPQNVLHVSRDMNSSRLILMGHAKWASDNGLTVRRAKGEEGIIWPDGSNWSLSSEAAIFGRTTSLALCDEAWDVQLDATVQGALIPTLVERVRPQLWLLSTAHPLSTATMPTFRRAAMAGSDEVMLSEWGAQAGADPHDPATWRAATPHWSEQRAKIIASQRETPSLLPQWLNVWPQDDPTAGSWLPTWDSLGHAQGSPQGGLAALETTGDRSHYGACVLRLDADGLHAWTFGSRDLSEVLAWVQDRDPAYAMVGVSLRYEAEAVLYCRQEPVGNTETRRATAFLQDAVRRGAVRHDHNPMTSEQVANARVAEVETGPMLSQRRSPGPIPIVKALAWAIEGVGTGRVPMEAPAIL